MKIWNILNSLGGMSCSFPWITGSTDWVVALLTNRGALLQRHLLGTHSTLTIYESLVCLLVVMVLKVHISVSYFDLFPRDHFFCLA